MGPLVANAARKGDDIQTEYLPAHDHADELIKVNRAPGFLSSTETEATLSIVGKLMK